jgi:ABC-type transport system involved in multi-copper enzyme maturation permease subunit
MMYRLRWLTRPIFGKELRVSSRRRRNYWLRLAYVMLLAIYIATVWIPNIEFQRSSAMSSAQMEKAARVITQGIVWFQFFGAQLVAVVMMSTAISEEVYGRTLCSLMMTPLGGLQVVAGKLAGRLFQILLLVATSLPLLAIVRVLGGIPWDYLIGSLCITLAAVVFVSSVSLFFSTLCRRSYGVVILSAVGIGGVFLFLPFVAFILFEVPIWEWQSAAGLLYVNPYALLAEWTDSMMRSRTGIAFPLLQKVVACCAFLLVAAAFFFASSARLVGHVALRRAMGQRVWLNKRRTAAATGTTERRASRRRSREIRRVSGPPMIWRELVRSLSRRQRIVAYLAIGAELLMLLIAYTFGAVMEVMGYEATHLAYIWTFLSLAVLFTVVVSATLVSAEKEARTWPLLLLTPLRDRDILVGKFAGLIRRCGPVWLPLVVYVLLFAWAGIFDPMAVPHILAFSLAVLFFLGCTGLYLSSRIGRSTAAVTTHLALIGGFWLILPVVVSFLLNAGSWGRGGPDDFLENAAVFVPFVHGHLLAAGPLLEGELPEFEWVGLRGAGGCLVMIVTFTGSYLVAGSLFAARAAKAFRRTGMDAV